MNDTTTFQTKLFLFQLQFDKEESQNILLDNICCLDNTIFIVDHFMYQAYTFLIKYLDFKFCSVISNIVTW